VNAEFNWWLLIVGLVVGAGLVWYVLMDARRREVDLDSTERPQEAAWLSATLGDEGWDVPPEAVERLLVHHRAYLEAPPPDPVPIPAAIDAEADGGTYKLAVDATVVTHDAAPTIAPTTTPGSSGSELPGDDRISGGP
jgi:hypothetical protein